MPAAIPDATRSRIVYLSALGYTQREIAEVVGVSRNTVRKYLRRARGTVEDAEEPRQVLADIVQDRFDWERPDPAAIRGFGDMPM